jgi:hypothetical protein
MRKRFLLSLICMVFVAGCTVFRSTPPLPVRYSVPLGPQLVINSDFKLAEESRLLDELKILRGRISRTLELAVSDQPIQVYLFKSDKNYRRFLKAHFPDFPKRRAFFVQRKGELSVYAHFSDRVAEDLRHEVSHGYMHSVMRRVPLWLDEGLAEYFEMPLEHQGTHAQHIRELIEVLEPEEGAKAWSPDLARLEKLSDATAMQQLEYAESWAWVHWMLETTPERRDVLQSYLRSLRKGGKQQQLSEWLLEHEIDFDKVQLTEHIRYLNERAKR